MAVYRQLYTSFWQDDFILSLPYIERYFYIYLMTNSKTSICGIYELPRAIAVMETGLPLAKINELLEKFEKKYHRIVCSKTTNEIIITNWLKYNGNPSPKVQTAIKTGFDSVKDKSLIQYRYGIDTVSKNEDTVSPSDCSMFSDNAIVNVPVIEEDLSTKKEDLKLIISKWNEVEGIAHIDCIEHKRLEHVETRIQEKGFDKFLQMIENVKVSPFLLGKVKGKEGSTFKATFDWCILPNNFQKVLDGNYIQQEAELPHKETFQEEVDRRVKAVQKIMGVEQE